MIRKFQKNMGKILELKNGKWKWPKLEKIANREMTFRLLFFSVYNNVGFYLKKTPKWNKVLLHLCFNKSHNDATTQLASFTAKRKKNITFPGIKYYAWWALWRTVLTSKSSLALAVLSTVIQSSMSLAEAAQSCNFRVGVIIWNPWLTCRVRQSAILMLLISTSSNITACNGTKKLHLIQHKSRRWLLSNKFDITWNKSTA